jgi:hypothetical protein
VYCRVPPVVVTSLNKLQRLNPKYFLWTGKGECESAVADAQRSFRKLFDLADVSKSSPYPVASSRRAPWVKPESVGGARD